VNAYRRLSTPLYAFHPLWIAKRSPTYASTVLYA
jgi:hypothetical protein